MTTRENSNSETQLFNFPLSLNNSLNNNNEMDISSVIYWINSFEFNRPKKGIARDFSDASKKISHYIV